MFRNICLAALSSVVVLLAFNEAGASKFTLKDVYYSIKEVSHETSLGECPTAAGQTRCDVRFSVVPETRGLEATHVSCNFSTVNDAQIIRFALGAVGFNEAERATYLEFQPRLVAGGQKVTLNEDVRQVYNAGERPVIQVFGTGFRRQFTSMICSISGTLHPR